MSPDRSVRCECGFVFDLDDPGAVLRGHARARESARAHMIGGILLAGLGVGLSALSYLRASEQGGVYFFWTGMVMGGLILAMRSYNRIRAIRAVERRLNQKAG